MQNAIESFEGKRVLITGHTGFKGSWLAYILNSAGAKVFGYSLAEPSSPEYSYFALGVNEAIRNSDSAIGDIRDGDRFDALLETVKPDFVFHLAAQALVLESFRQPRETFTTNVVGTINVLEGVRNYCPNATLVLVTSDKCYLNDGRASGYVEADRLGGKDPYSGSKAAAEIVAHSYMSSFLHEYTGGVATVRAGNVFGGGDWSADRLVPDAVRHFRVSQPLSLRMPEATRPWTWVIDILAGYISLAVALANNKVESGQSWNFASGETLTVLEIAESISAAFALDKSYILKGVSDSREAELLQIDPQKAASLLGWKPVGSVREALAKTADWYKAQSEGEDMVAYSTSNVLSLLSHS